MIPAKPSTNHSRPYLLFLTNLSFVFVAACVSTDPQPPPVVTVAVGSTPVASLSAKSLDVEPTARSPKRMWTWQTDPRDARVRARAEHMPLVVYVRADWSAGALAMDRQVWSDPQILFSSRAVVPLRIDVTDGPDAELWADEYRVTAVPTTIFFDADGYEAARLEGTRSVDEVLSALRQLGDDTLDR
ncbi:MAG TPA: thioredoxin family protein [Polyangium sp.]|nr:thioredoxin family protein [Polyangium sp.]